jgi:DNA-binding response OmpR family regulator
MLDPRTPRPLKPRTLSVLVIDANKYTLQLLSDILRNLDVGQVVGARDLDVARKLLGEKLFDLVVLSWEPGDPLDGHGFIRQLRRANDARVRQLPLILVMSGLTREKVLAGRDAGADEFVAKPIAPAALQQRLQMVIETPRPFVDHPVYIGPCRRRKNPADYHGQRRRQGEQSAATPIVDAEEEAARDPVRLLLADLRAACATLLGGEASGLPAAIALLAEARKIAVTRADRALVGSLSAFEAYLSAAAGGGLDAKVVEVALTALEQLAALPPAFKDARESVALALGKAIHKKLVA